MSCLVDKDDNRRGNITTRGDEPPELPCAPGTSIKSLKEWIRNNNIKLPLAPGYTIEEDRQHELLHVSYEGRAPSQGM